MFNVLARLLSTSQGVEPVASPPVQRPVLIDPPEPKAKPYRGLAGPRMEGGLNRAVMRADTAARCYLLGAGTLREVAEDYVSVHYVRAVLHLRRTNQCALLKAAMLGDIGLLRAVKTDVVASIAVVN